MDLTKRALVIVHEQDGGPCLVGEHLSARGYDLTEHLVTAKYDEPNNAAAFPSLAGFDLLVLMGSVRSLTRKAEISGWVYDELAMIHAAHESGMPVLGVCFGGQLISDALGGSVEVAPVTEIGWYNIEGANLPAGQGPWMEWHHDRFDPPPEAEVLATTANAVQLFRLGKTVGTQFHPEVTEAHVKAFVAASPAEYFEEHAIDSDALLVAAAQNEARNREQCRVFVDWFIDEVANAV